jgi:DNA-binding XRE family transcriptional regulator
LTRRSAEQARLKKRREYLRLIGRPSLITGKDVERALNRARSFPARGMSYVQMAKQTGVHARTIAHAIDQNRPTMRRTVWEPLMAMRFEEPAPHIWVDATGTRRRLRALWLEGYPLPWLAARTGFGNRNYFQSIIRGTKGAAGIQYGNTRAVAELYDKLEGASPAGFGIDQRTGKFANAFARKKGCLPRAVWDDSTIDDPQALPDWTGRCGTRFGMAVHRREGIPVCQPCEEAYTGELYPGFSGARLRSLRERQGWSRKALAERVRGVDASTIQYWEGGRSIPSRQFKLDRVLDVLDATYEDVCEDT